MIEERNWTTTTVRAWPDSSETLKRWVIEAEQNAVEAYKLGRAERKVIDLIIGTLYGMASVCWIYLIK